MKSDITAFLYRLYKSNLKQITNNNIHIIIVTNYYLISHRRGEIRYTRKYWAVSVRTMGDNII